MDDTLLSKHLAAASRERQRIPVIRVDSPGEWDLSDSDDGMLREIAQIAIDLAEESGADPDDVEALRVLLDSVK